MTRHGTYVLYSFMVMAAEQNTDQQTQDAQYYRRVLHDLIDIGVDLAHLVRQQARSQAASVHLPGNLPPATPAHNQTPDTQTIAPAAASDPAISFDRLARAIRRTVMLARKLHEPLPAPAASEADRRTAARKHIIRAVEDTIQRNARPENEAARLHAEFLDRLDEPDLDDDINVRPVADIIKDICRDLGIEHVPGTHPWKRRTPADVALLAARAAMPSRPEGSDNQAESRPATVVAMRPRRPSRVARTTDPP